MAKLKDTLWFALQCAKSDRQSLVDAYGGDRKEKAVRNAEADIKAFEALQIKLFGSSKSKLDIELDNAETVNILDFNKLKKMVKENPELFNIAEGSEL